MAVTKPGPKKGYKQSVCHIEKRIKRGVNHPNWVGDNVSSRGGRSRALRMFCIEPCESCGCSDAERHHIDENTANNTRDNIQFLCRKCHMIEHAKRNKNRGIKPNVRPAITAAAIAKKARTHCKNGHSLTTGNIYVNPRGARVCKECRSNQCKQYRTRRKQNASH